MRRPHQCARRLLMPFLLRSTLAWSPHSLYPQFMGTYSVGRRATFPGTRSFVLSTPRSSSTANPTPPPQRKTTLAVPKIGDIVTFEGKWKDESGVGRLATLQYIADRGQWIADIVVFKEIEPGLYRETKRGRASEYMDVTALKPVLASYVRETDGWRVPIDKATGLVRPSAPAYIIDDTFELPKPVIDEDKYTQYLEEYEELKGRLLRDTLLFGAAGSAATLATQGAEDGAIFALGVLVGAGYLLLLQQQADRVGQAAPSAPASLDIGSTRFFLPVMLVLGLAARQYATGFEGFDYDAPPQVLNVVPKDQFISAVLGFLSYRVPLLYTELKGAFTGGIADGLVEVLPGSVAKTVQVVNQYNKKKPGPSMDASTNEALRGINSVDENAPAKVLLVAGPPATGKSSLLEALFRDEGYNVHQRLCRPAIVTTRPARVGEETEGNFEFVDRLTFEQLEREGQLVASWAADGTAVGAAAMEIRSGGGDVIGGTAEGMSVGSGELCGLRLDNVLTAGRGGSICVIDAKDTDAADAVATALEKRPEGELTLIGLWVSLNQLEDFETRLKVVNPDLDDDSPQLRAELKKVIAAIEWGVMSGLFEFTVINEDRTVAMAEIKKAVTYLRGEETFEGISS